MSGAQAEVGSAGLETSGKSDGSALTHIIAQQGPCLPLPS